MAREPGRLAQLIEQLKARVDAGELTDDEAIAQIQDDPEVRQAMAERLREDAAAWPRAGSALFRWLRRR